MLYLAMHWINKRSNKIDKRQHGRFKDLHSPTSFVLYIYIFFLKLNPFYTVKKNICNCAGILPNVYRKNYGSPGN